MELRKQTRCVGMQVDGSASTATKYRMCGAQTNTSFVYRKLPIIFDARQAGFYLKSVLKNSKPLQVSSADQQKQELISSWKI